EILSVDALVANLALTKNPALAALPDEIEEDGKHAQPAGIHDVRAANADGIEIARVACENPLALHLRPAVLIGRRRSVGLDDRPGHPITEVHRIGGREDNLRNPVFARQLGDRPGRLNIVAVERSLAFDRKINLRREMENDVYLAPPQRVLEGIPITRVGVYE